MYSLHLSMGTLSLSSKFSLVPDRKGKLWSTNHVIVLKILPKFNQEIHLCYFSLLHSIYKNSTKLVLLVGDGWGGVGKVVGQESVFVSIKSFQLTLIDLIMAEPIGYSNQATCQSTVMTGFVISTVNWLLLLPSYLLADFFLFSSTLSLTIEERQPHKAKQATLGINDLFEDKFHTIIGPY